MVNFPTQIPGCGSQSPVILDFFLSSDPSICSIVALRPLGNSDHVVVSVSFYFSSNSKRGAPFHRTVYDYSCADKNGLCDHLRDVSWEDIFKLSASAAAAEFQEWVQGQITNSVLKNGKSTIPSLINGHEVLPSASDKKLNCLLKTFLGKIILMIQVSF